MLRANVELDHLKAEACARVLRQVVERLNPVGDLSPLVRNLTPEGVTVAAIAGAPPSKCVARVHAMLEGGLSGLRAFVHLATEASCIQQLGFDPFASTTALEKVLPLAGKSNEEQVLARHAALFDQELTRGVWARSHVEAVRAELGLVEVLVTAKLPRPPDKGLLFWFDPGLTEDQINLNADVSMKLGLVVPPRSAAPKAAYHQAYAELVALARG